MIMFSLFLSNVALSENSPDDTDNQHHSDQHNVPSVGGYSFTIPVSEEAKSNVRSRIEMKTTMDFVTVSTKCYGYGSTKWKKRHDNQTRWCYGNYMRIDGQACTKSGRCKRIRIYGCPHRQHADGRSDSAPDAKNVDGDRRVSKRCILVSGTLFNMDSKVRSWCVPHLDSCGFGTSYSSRGDNWNTAWPGIKTLNSNPYKDCSEDGYCQNYDD